MRTTMNVMLALSLGIFFSVACRTTKTSSPLDTVKTACAAIQEKDVAAFRRTYSKQRLASYVTVAQQGHMTEAEVYKQLLDNMQSCTPAMETRELKITGETATLLVRDHGEPEFAEIHFVKEENEWKFGP